MAEFRVLEYLAEGEPVKEAALRSATKASRAIITGMVRKKWITRADLSDASDASRTVKVAILKSAEGKLNANQKLLLDTLAGAVGGWP